MDPQQKFFANVGWVFLDRLAHSFDVPARHEVLAGAGEDDAADLVVVFDIVQRLVKLGAHFHA